FNQKMRFALFGGSKDRFVPGDWLMLKNQFAVDQVPLVRNSEEVRVLNVEPGKLVGVGGFWDVHDLTVRNEDGEVVTIPVLKHSEEARFYGLVAQLRDKAIDSKNNRDWADFYDLQEQFAQVDYAYAITVHKSQGSTYDTAYVHMRDLFTCK